MSSLFVSNLHPDCTEATLYRKFSAAGEILNIHIRREKGTKRSLGYGYINFSNKADAEKALNSMNYDLIKGKPVHLMWIKSNTNKFNSEANIFVQNLDKSIDEKTLLDIFSSYGTIQSLKIATDKEGKSKGIGFVQFEDEASANAAINGVNNMLIKGLKVLVTKLIPKSKKFKNVYIKNFQLDFNDEDLNNLFEKFGTIVSAKVMTDENGQSKGFGFVSFKDADSAENAVAELNGKLINGKCLFVGKAKKKSERQAEILEKFMKKLQSTEP